MKKIFAIILLAAIPALTGCKKERPEFDYAEKGPELTVLELDAAAYMGAGIAFSVDMSDSDYALSTLKAELLFDDTVVSSKTIRTKQQGQYDDVIDVPLLKDIPDGVATLRLTAQNIGLAKTVVDSDISISRPNFETIQLVSDAKTYTLRRVGDFHYEATGVFPASFKAVAKTPAINSLGQTITIGWDGTALAVDGNQIPFNHGVEESYTVSLDLMKLTAAPLEPDPTTVDIFVNGVQASVVDAAHFYVSPVYLEKGRAIEFEGLDISTWWPDPDYLYIDDALRFGAMSGWYRIDLYTDKGYATFKRTDDTGVSATSLDGALWLMAWGLANWKFSNDGVADGNDNQLAFNPGSSYCMAEVEKDVFQFSGYAVENTDTETLGGRFRYDWLSAKWFGQDGWGNEKGSIKGTATTVQYTDRALQYLKPMSGGDNIELADGVQLELGSFYVLRIDISAAGFETVDFYKK